MLRCRHLAPHCGETLGFLMVNSPYTTACAQVTCCRIKASLEVYNEPAVQVTWRSSDGQTLLYDNGRLVWNVVRGKRAAIPSGGTLVIGREQDCVGGCFDSNAGAARPPLSTLLCMSAPVSTTVSHIAMQLLSACQ